MRGVMLVQQGRYADRKGLCRSLRALQISRDGVVACGGVVVGLPIGCGWFGSCLITFVDGLPNKRCDITPSDRQGHF
ncbi:unnamed protein product [Prunus armeniaca]|uniref:Uncharacterized protein n=1 Tax=Prunus armeniaca TaxID=36596 RepID=A0A6J5VC29_PRUAR|nr:unnamed protein product [Prunus armeniaca]